MNFSGNKNLPASKRATTVFELGGEDKRGVLMQATNLLERSGCDVRSLAVSSGPATKLIPLVLVLPCIDILHHAADISA